MSYSFLAARKGQFVAVILALSLPAISGCSGSPLAPALPGPGAGHASVRELSGSSYTYTTIDDPADPTYNVLTGINNLDKISGYYGNGSTSHPAHGYVAYEPYGPQNFRHEDYPSAKDTYITSLNNRKAIAGWFIPPDNQKNWIYGCGEQGGIWTEYKDPQLRHGKSNITELLGLNDAGLAVGFYQDDKGVNHGFELDQQTGKYHSIIPPGAISVQATGINGKGDVVGYATIASGATLSWLLKGGAFTIFSYPLSLNTKALGVNWQDQVVGKFVDAKGNTHGFILTNPLNSQSWQQIDEPNAAGTTVVTGIEDHRNFVGYYVDSAGNTNGFLATLAPK
jgi:hypothetical protein